MKKFEEFNEYERLIDLQNRLAHCYKDIDSKHIFYVEECFHHSFENVISVYPNKKEEILNVIKEYIKKNPITLFTLDFENFYVQKEHAIIVTLEDICLKVQLDIENKSRGSDYGD